jgi:hypothetical protein
MSKEQSVQIEDVALKFPKFVIAEVIDTGMIYPTYNSMKDHQIKECSFSQIN